LVAILAAALVVVLFRSSDQTPTREPDAPSIVLPPAPADDLAERILECIRGGGEWYGDDPPELVTGDGFCIGGSLGA
jgi:hypothetical protein